MICIVPPALLMRGPTFQFERLSSTIPCVEFKLRHHLVFGALDVVRPQTFHSFSIGTHRSMQVTTSAFHRDGTTGVVIPRAMSVSPVANPCDWEFTAVDIVIV